MLVTILEGKQILGVISSKAPRVITIIQLSPSIMTTARVTLGTEKLIAVKNGASEQLQKLLERQGRADGGLRIKVIGGGCSGLQYQMDLVVASNGVRVVIDPKSALFVGGSELDYSGDLQHGGFKVSNPNAAVTCSCGESFAA